MGRPTRVRVRLTVRRGAVLMAVPALLALALPAGATPEQEQWMTGGGDVVMTTAQGSSGVARIGLDLPCEENPPTTQRSRFDVTWPTGPGADNSFHLEDMGPALCTLNANTGGGTHDSHGTGRCHTRTELGTPVVVPAHIDWDVTDGGYTQTAPPRRGRPTASPQPTRNDDHVHITITDNDNPLAECELEADGVVDGELQFHSKP